ncbi:MAG: RNase adapter RapZ [Acidimicrobiia bacterium]|nr:RNase adapter RapZ [Acidimicrobiia bacterium]
MSKERTMGDDAVTNPQVLILTGMSGAGRSTAAKVLEDLGYYVIDNLPPGLIHEVVDLNDLLDSPRPLAVVIDSRGGFPVAMLQEAISGLERDGIAVTVTYLDADDDVLIRRYEEHRRPHPLAHGTVADAIAAEREMMTELRASADLYLNTSDTNVHELRQRIERHFSELQVARPMRVSVTSFGFKNGSPRDVDVMFDVRFLPNPHWKPELRPLTGRDAPVRDYVLGQPDAKEFLEHVHAMLSFLVPRFRDEGKSYVSIGIGCTGGRHRSVAITEELGTWLSDEGFRALVRHRDADR